MNIHQYRTIIEDISFYEGQSYHPIHRVLKIPIHILKIAQLIATEDQKDLAINEMKQLIVFTEEQTKYFHILQLMASNYLSKNNLHGFAAPHKVELSPNLLLPIITEETTSNTVTSNHQPFEQSEISDSKDSEKGSSNKNKKKKKKSAKKKAVPVNTILEKKHEETEETKELEEEEVIVEEHQSETKEYAEYEEVGEQRTIIKEEKTNEVSTNLPDPNTLPTPIYSAPMNKVEEFLNESETKGFSVSPHKLRQIVEESFIACETADVTSSLQSIRQLCREYEQTIEEIREKYESIIQATNLKLFIKENQIESLQEKLRTS